MFAKQKFNFLTKNTQKSQEGENLLNLVTKFFSTNLCSTDVKLLWKGPVKKASSR